MVFFHSVSEIGGLHVFRQIINHTFFFKDFYLFLNYPIFPFPIYHQAI